MWGVNRLGHVIFVVPPCIIRPFAAARDAAVINCLEVIQQYEVEPYSTHALPVGVGGSSLHFLERHGRDSHLGTYYRIAGPLIARLLVMGGLIPRKTAELLLSPTSAKACEGWASHLLQIHGVVEGKEGSFTPEGLKTVFLLSPRGLFNTLSGEPNSVNKELPQAADTDVLSPSPLSPRCARGVKRIAVGIGRLTDWRHFLDNLKGAPDHVRTKLLTHSSHGSVSVLLAKIPHAINVSAEAARNTIRRLTEAPALGH